VSATEPNQLLLFTVKNTQIQNVKVGDYWVPSPSPLTTRRGGGVYLNKDSVRTSQKTLRVRYGAQPGTAVYCEEHTDTECRGRRLLGSLSVASYDSQGYGGGILTRHHTGMTYFSK
jgi:hypothetical protein